MNPPKLDLYNGLIEHAARSIVLFECFFPHRLSLEDIRVMEHLAVYGEDVGYKTSLQNRVEGRAAAFRFREETVRDAIAFLIAGGFVEGDEDGGYKATAEERWAYGLSDHGDEIFRVCCHMRDKADEIGVQEYIASLKADILARVDEPLGGMPDDPEFRLYEDRLNKDVVRMEGLDMAVYQFKRNLNLKVSDHPCLDADWLESLSVAAEKEAVGCERRIRELQRMRSAA
jgi:hypothetical protein